jgi:hypothetical protein
MSIHDSLARSIIGEHRAMTFFLREANATIVFDFPFLCVFWSPLNGDGYGVSVHSRLLGTIGFRH